MAHYRLPSQLRIAELDYDQILSNLVEFMKTDPAFADYDFSGSGLNLIARVLAYVTFYNNYYLSAAVNESFLDTAQLRSSVVSHARMLGYQAHGTLSATYSANVTAVMSSNTAAYVTLPKNTKFELQSNTAYTFYTVDDYTLTQNTANGFYYETTGVTLVEGTPATYSFTVDTNNPTQRFIIPNANVDFGHITVEVLDSAGSSTSTTFYEATNLVTANAGDPIFILQETYNGYPELKFGNTIVGRPLETGNVVRVSYYISRGTDGNNIRGPFRINDTTIPGLVRGVTATPDADTTPSNGGAAPEDLDQIRFVAPLVYASQNRCVTTDDYRALILSEYGEMISALNVFGGEEGNPADVNEQPVYGRVYIAAKPKTGTRLTETVRKEIIDRVIRPHSVVGVVPEIIDPDYIYMIVSTRALYDPRLTTLRRSELATAIKNAILDYTASSIEKFDTQLRFSKLVRAIDAADPSINSSLTRIELQKRFSPVVNALNTLVIKFGAPIQRVGNTSAILPATSHRFDYTANGVNYTNCYFAEQNGTVQIKSTETAYQYTFTATSNSGQIVDSVSYTYDTSEPINETLRNDTVLALYSRNPGTTVTTNPIQSVTRREVTIVQNIGSFNIDTGVMTLSNFKPTAIEGNALEIWINVLPLQSDLVPSLNRLFTVDPDTIVVEVTDESAVSSAASFYQGGVLR